MEDVGRSSNRRTKDEPKDQKSIETRGRSTQITGEKGQGQ